MAKPVFKGTFYGTTTNARPARVDLNLQQVNAALDAGLVSVGDRVSVRVKVGKKRRLYKAFLRELIQTCCEEHATTPYGYFAERQPLTPG